MRARENRKRPETLADIVAAKRRLAAEMAKSLGDQHSSVEALTWEADRIEAAVKREREKNSSAERHCFRQRCRDALQQASYFLHRHHTGAVYAPDGETLIFCEDVAKIVDAALAAPARNCDRFEDDDYAFAAWHDALNDGDVVSVRNAFKWLFAKAEGGAQ